MIIIWHKKKGSININYVQNEILTNENGINNSKSNLLSSIEI